MTVIRAAFDASKCSPRGITTVAGYIADTDMWQSVEERWNAQLAAAELETFHLADIKRRHRGDDWLKVVKPFAQIIRLSLIHI